MLLLALALRPDSDEIKQDKESDQEKDLEQFPTGGLLSLGLGMGAVALVGALIAVAWAAVGIYLGRNFAHKSESNIEEETHGAA